MAEIKFTISDSNLLRVKEALNNLFPKPKNEDGSSPFTDEQWARECVRRFIIETVARNEQMKAQQAIKFNKDNDLLS